MLLKEITVNYQISEDLDFCLFQSSKMFYFFFFFIFCNICIISHLLYSHCFVSSCTMLFFGVLDESRLHDKTSWWLWRRLSQEVQVTKNCYLSLENTLKSPRLRFFTMLTNQKNNFFSFFFKSHLQWLLLTFSMYTSCIVIAVEYNKLNVQLHLHFIACTF